MTTFIRCTKCGATTEAACNCGAPYMPAGQRAAEALKANPEKSDYTIAEELGVGKDTVRRARQSTSANALVDDTTGTAEPEKRVGRDGKTRRMPQRKPSRQQTSGRPKVEDQPSIPGNVPPSDLYAAQEQQSPARSAHHAVEANDTQLETENAALSEQLDQKQLEIERLVQEILRCSGEIALLKAGFANLKRENAVLKRQAAPEAKPRPMTEDEHKTVWEMRQKLAYLTKHFNEAIERRHQISEEADKAILYALNPNRTPSDQERSEGLRHYLEFRKERDRWLAALPPELQPKRIRTTSDDAGEAARKETVH